MQSLHISYLTTAKENLYWTINIEIAASDFSFKSENDLV